MVHGTSSFLTDFETFCRLKYYWLIQSFDEPTKQRLVDETKPKRIDTDPLNAMFLDVESHTKPQGMLTNG